MVRTKRDVHAGNGARLAPIRGFGYCLDRIETRSYEAKRR
jgi:hypothetical protein